MNKSPWEDRSRELEAKHGPYCMFAAWEEWVGARDDNDILGTLNQIDKAYLYAMFEAAVDQTTVCDQAVEGKRPL